MEEREERDCDGLTATPVLLPLRCSLEIWMEEVEESGRRSEAETSKKWWEKAILVFFSLFHTFKLYFNC